MRVALGKFACGSIEARFGTDISAGVQAALRYYTRCLSSARVPAAVPSFCRRQAPDGSGNEFELALDPEIEAALESEAQRQAVKLDQLLVHAVFVYLADLDAATEASGLPATPLAL